VATVASIRDAELLGELEDELHELEDESHEHEDELESEGIFGAIGNALGGLLGEGEDEWEAEDESAFQEHEDEAFLEGEWEDESAFQEHEWEDESAFQEHEWEHEAGELFFGKLIKRALPVLRSVVKVAAPALGTAFGGPLGGRLAGMLASQLEMEHEHEHELEIHEGEYEAHAMVQSENEAHAELMAAAAAGAATEHEAEALIGAATWGVLSPRERRELRRVSAHLVRANHIILRLLRRRRITRPMVRTVPYITKMTARTLVRQQARTGRPITRRQAARVMTAHTRRVLTQPRLCSLALQRNVRATRQVQRVARVPVRGLSTSTRPSRRVRY
jgi:hypothetical protein